MTGQSFESKLLFLNLIQKVPENQCKVLEKLSENSMNQAFSGLWEPCRILLWNNFEGAILFNMTFVSVEDL